MLEHFHFIRPLWLLALLPLALLAWVTFRPAGGGNAWRRVVDARLLPLMMADGAATVGRSGFALASAGWLLATLALANPTWDLKPQPVFQTNAARVVALDLARSMNDADMKPSRLARARYKVEDVLGQAAEGQTALVAYAGDAFTVAPLTRDTNTISALLKVLQPELMPVDGSRADLGLLKAGELLHQAGVASGQILLIADGVEPARAADAQRAAARLRSEGYTVSVLGVGTPDGAPLTDSQGRLVRTDAGAVEVPRLDAATLGSIAHAGGGRYQAITDAGTGLQSLLGTGAAGAHADATPSKAVAPAWKERGPFVVLLLLPLAALAFRRNWLVSATLLAALVVPSQAALAASWSDAWQRPDQQADKALAAGDYARAAAVAPDVARRGSAEYKRGDYQVALADFSQATGPDADYNRGNALARLGRYQEAVAAYDKAISETASNADAKANKAAVEALLKRTPPPKDQQQQQQQQQQKSGAGKQDSKSNGGSRGSGNQGQQGQQDQPGQSGQAAKPDAGSQAKGSVANPGSNASKDGASPGARAAAKSSETGQPASPNGHDGQAGSAPGNAATRPGDDFAKAAQQVGKAGDSPGQDAAGRKTSPPSAGQDAAGRAAASAPSGDAQAIEGEQRQAAEQWLRRIPDDPGGLLRRKFLYQYRHRANQPTADE